MNFRSLVTVESPFCIVPETHVRKSSFLKDVLQDMLLLQCENAPIPRLVSSTTPVWNRILNTQKAKAALCFVCMLTNIAPLESYQHWSFNTNINMVSWLLCARVSDLCLWAVLWSTAGQTSEICKNILLFFSQHLDLVVMAQAGAAQRESCGFLASYS